MPNIKLSSLNKGIVMKTSLPKIKLYGGDKKIKENGFIRVDKNINNSIYFDNPESNLYGKQYFYVMQYQARNNGGVPTSTGSGLPWTRINQINAKAVSEAAGYHLMTNWEWMAIARDIEQVAENWTGGAVGSGMIKRGNVGITDAGSYDGDNPETGVLNTKAILKLSNGSEIYHFSGNVWEWVDDKFDCGVKECPASLMPQPATASYQEFTAITSWGKYSRTEIAPSGSYNSTQGTGQIYTTNNFAYSSEPPAGYNSTIHAFVRGGRWGIGAAAGVFALSLYNSPSSSSGSLGFRCAR